MTIADVGAAAVAHEKAGSLAPLRVETRELPQNSPVFDEIQTRVQQSLPRHVVTKLERIDNNELLLDFKRQKDLVAAKPANAAQGGTVENKANVRLAFHAMAGGPEELLEARHA